MIQQKTKLGAAFLICAGLIGTPLLAHAEMSMMEKRQEAMKTVGKSMKAMGAMAKGAAPFDGKAALAALNAMKTASTDFDKMFPEGTETGNDTEASPKIFSDRAGFEAKFAEFSAALESTTASEPADLDGVKAAMGAVGKSCKGCHESYRVKKDG